jgi:hypothetical protein
MFIQQAGLSDMSHEATVYFTGWTSSNPDCYPDMKKVEEEVNYLESLFPAVAQRMFLVKWYKGYPLNSNFRLLGAYRGGTIYIFAHGNPHSVQGTTAHEIGHMVYYRILTDQDRAEYIKLRGLTPSASSINPLTLSFEKIVDQPTEVFAEDFRVLFGSTEAKKTAYRPLSFAPPTQEERAWILSKIR